MGYLHRCLRAFLGWWIVSPQCLQVCVYECARSQHCVIGIGFNQRAIDKEAITGNQTSLLALTDDLREEGLVDGYAKPAAGFGEHRVVGGRLVEGVANEPHKRQVQPQLLG